MKKIISSAFMFCFYGFVSAQNTGINVPVPQEALHVDSVIKIGKNQSIGASTPGRKNQLKFGDDDYVSIAEEQLDDKLYIRSGDLVFLKSNGSVGNGRVGIGTETPAATLDVNGSVKLQVAGAAAGNVLTSDASGNATWQAPPAAPASIGFRAYLTTNASIPAAQYTVSGFSETFDDGNSFNPATGIFTVPSAGVYEFTAMIGWNAAPAGVVSYLHRLVLQTTGGGTAFIFQQAMPLTAVPGYGLNLPMSALYKLNAGDQVHLEVSHNSPSSIILSGGTGSNTTILSAVKIY